MVDNCPLAKHFDKAAASIKEHGKNMSSDDMKLVYGLYKQANFGDNNTEAPSFYQLTEKGKWNAWNDQKGKSKEQAQHEYVQVCLKYFPDDLKKELSS